MSWVCRYRLCCVTTSVEWEQGVGGGNFLFWLLFYNIWKSLKKSLKLLLLAPEIRPKIKSKNSGRFIFCHPMASCCCNHDEGIPWNQSIPGIKVVSYSKHFFCANLHSMALYVRISGDDNGVTPSVSQSDIYYLISKRAKEWIQHKGRETVLNLCCGGKRPHI